MRTLTNFGILALGDDGRFSLTPLGEPLRSDVPGSVRSSILTMAGQWSWQAWEAFPSTVKTGKPAIDMVFGMPVFDWLAQHPDEAKRFSETMVTVHGAEPRRLPATFPDSTFFFIALTRGYAASARRDAAVDTPGLPDTAHRTGGCDVRTASAAPPAAHARRRSPG